MTHSYILTHSDKQIIKNHIDIILHTRTQGELGYVEQVVWIEHVHHKEVHLIRDTELLHCYIC